MRIVRFASQRQQSVLPEGQRKQHIRQVRQRWDRLSRYSISCAGISVLLALATLFIYLFSEVVPLARQPEVNQDHHYQAEQIVAETSVPNELPSYITLPPGFQPAYVLPQSDRHYLFVGATEGTVLVFDLRQQHSEALFSVKLTATVEQLTSLILLKGGVSLLAGTSDGKLSQWFLIQHPQSGLTLQQARQFQPQQAAIQQLIADNKRGFIALTQNTLALYHPVSFNALLQQPLPAGAMPPAVLQGNTLLLPSAEHRYIALHIDNPHPDISWQSLWQPFWYEGWQQPERVWQSSAADDSYEAKLSLYPLAAGTLKAAFFAMLFAVPLAVMAAIYTACFMTAGVRNKVKSTIEMMEALPTVIIGFVAGLWLAPFVEQHLTAVFSLLLLLPAFLLLLAIAVSRLPMVARNRLKNGLEIVVLLPVIILLVWGCFELSPWLEQGLFGGDSKHWLAQQGIDYQQRNALVIGIAMGFAVIPSVFSIAEEAIYNVPSHLRQGALALGATPWQAVMKIMVPTASPGIFSAVMIGFGRAIGETMIVLMATGNNPVGNFNLFDGLRSLAASLAIELPEAAAGSSHFRVLFLAAILLFLFTFCANTLAELVRQRLRRQYQNM